MTLATLILSMVGRGRGYGINAPRPGIANPGELSPPGDRPWRGPPRGADLPVARRSFRAKTAGLRVSFVLPHGLLLHWRLESHPPWFAPPGSLPQGGRLSSRQGRTGFPARWVGETPLKAREAQWGERVCNPPLPEVRTRCAKPTRSVAFKPRWLGRQWKRTKHDGERGFANRRYPRCARASSPGRGTSCARHPESAAP